MNYWTTVWSVETVPCHQNGSLSHLCWDLHTHFQLQDCAGNHVHKGPIIQGGETLCPEHFDHCWDHTNIFAHLYESLFIWLLFRFLCHNPQEESRHKNPLPIGRCWAQIGYFSAAAGCHLPWKRNLEWRWLCRTRHAQGRARALPSALQTLHKSLFLTGSWICTVPCIQGGCGSTGKVRASTTAFQAELLQQNPFALPAATDCTRRTPNFY